MNETGMMGNEEKKNSWMDLKAQQPANKASESGGKADYLFKLLLFVARRKCIRAQIQMGQQQHHTMVIQSISSHLKECLAVTYPSFKEGWLASYHWQASPKSGLGKKKKTKKTTC